MINIGDLLINKETQENYVVLSIVNSHPEEIVIRPKYEDNINIEEMILLSGDQNYTNGKTSIIVSLNYLHENWQIP